MQQWNQNNDHERGDEDNDDDGDEQQDFATHLNTDVDVIANGKDKRETRKVGRRKKWKGKLKFSFRFLLPKIVKKLQENWKKKWNLFSFNDELTWIS